MKPPEREALSAMTDLFHRIAPRYDLITRLFSFGMDMGWKRDAVRGARLAAGARVLDLACGTGDFARMTGAVGCDLTHRMLALSGLGRAVCADAMRLPFGGGAFDAVFAGYGLRNFPDLDGALREIARVLRPGGQIVALDFFLPAWRPWRAVYLGYLWVTGWWWGLVLHGRPRTYTYIPDSIAAFETLGGMEERLRGAGFRTVRARSILGGGIGIVWAAL